MTDEPDPLELDETGLSNIITADSAKPLRLEWMDPNDLAVNDFNWRTHPEAQTKALAALINSEVGWAGALLYNEQTQRLVDGHARKKIAKGGLVPVLVGSWDEATERKILATLDPLGALARAGSERLAMLLEQVHSDSAPVKKLLRDLAETAKPTEPLAVDADAAAGSVQHLYTCPECGHQWAAKKGGA